jgi:hypothetical protein
MSPSTWFLLAARACAGASGPVACTFAAAPDGDRPAWPAARDRTAAARAAKPATVVTGAPAR